MTLRLLLVLALLSMPCFAVWTPVQHTRCGATAASIDCAFPGNVTAHNQVFAIVGNNGNASLTATGVVNATYSSLIQQANGAQQVQIFCFPDSAAGAETITIGNLGGNYTQVSLIEFSGGNASSCTGGASNSSTTASSGNFTVAVGSLILGAGLQNGSLAAGSGYTICDSTDGFYGCEYQTAAGTTVAATFTGSGAPMATVGFEIKAPASVTPTGGMGGTATMGGSAKAGT
jgi:hypothetical protein